MGLFGQSKLNREEFSNCLEYLEDHYKLTTFQEKEADKYNEALTRYGPSLTTDEKSARSMLEVAERFKQAAHELLVRSKRLVSVPQAAGALHFAYQIVFSDYIAWVDSQYAAYAAIVEHKSPSAKRVQELFQQHDRSHQKALKEEKQFLKRLLSNGLTPNDIQQLTDRAFSAIEAESQQNILDISDASQNKPKLGFLKE